MNSLFAFPAPIETLPTMKPEDILDTPGMRDALTATAPLSPYTARTLTLVDREFTHCMEPQWWIGQQDGVYTHQVRQPVGPDDVERAVPHLPMDADRDAIILGCAVWRSEIAQRLRTRAGQLIAEATAIELKAAEAAARRAEFVKDTSDELRPLGFEHGRGSKSKRDVWRGHGVTICGDVPPVRQAPPDPSPIWRWRVVRGGMPVLPGSYESPLAAAQAFLATVPT